MQLKERYLNAKRKIITKYLCEKLNPEQAKAVSTVNGPLLIIAGAGSGKTTVLVRRISFIIKYGDAYYSDYMPADVDEAFTAELERAYSLPAEELGKYLDFFAVNPCPPYAMLAITFTNKAANEIKERLKSVLDDENAANEIWAGTFHSICVKILRRHGGYGGYESNFSIYDTEDKKHLLASVMKDLEIDEKILAVKTVANEISSAKDRLITAEDYPENENLRGRHIHQIYLEYQKRLREVNALDFDDIIAETVYLLQKNPDIAEYYQRKFRYVCVDEYQDTNYAQFVLTNILSDGYRNIMVVGDDDQSIYRFRGATIENILNFDKTYTDAAIIKLEQNYRSTKTILDAANAVISNNGNRRAKSLWSTKGAGEKITVRSCSSQEDESRFIVNTIEKAVRTKGLAYKDFAVLYRINEIARSVESAFAKSGIPYRVVGGQRFFDKKEIRDMIAYLHIIENERDNERLKRIINEPKRKIGAATVEAVSEYAKQHGMPMLSVMRECESIPVFSKVATKLLGFASLIDGLRNSEYSVSRLVKEVFVATGYYSMLVDGGEVEKPRIAAVEELISAAEEYEQRAEEPSLFGFLEEITLISEVDKYDESSDAVVLMTVHSAKGLEFPHVFIAGMEENIFPSSQSSFSSDELSEERRLAYVAITRAKERLYITHASMRLLYGQTMCNPLSRFIKRELPQELISYDAAPKAPEYRGGMHYQPRPSSGEQLSNEFSRKVEIQAPKPKNPGTYGIKSFIVGQRVAHAVFGSGTIISAKEIGGDILYEIKFDSQPQPKKLMATYAKLSAI